MNKRVIEIDEKWKAISLLSEMRSNYDYLEEEALVTIPDNPTNGDMIKAIFGSFKYGSNGDYIHVWGVGGNGQLTFTWNWWNAPYKKVRNKE